MLFRYEIYGRVVVFESESRDVHKLKNTAWYEMNRRYGIDQEPDTEKITFKRDGLNLSINSFA